MKKILVVLAGLLAMYPAQACDVCGCSSASAANFPGNFNRENQLGWLYQFMAFQSLHLPSVQNGQVGYQMRSQEYFQVSAFTAGIRIIKNWQANVAIPLQYVSKTEESVQSHIFGMSDMQMGVTRFFEMDSIYKNHRLLMSASYALKLPTGKYHSDMISESVSRYMIPGTGSFDHFFRVNAQYIIKSWSVSLRGLYRVNGSTRDGLNWGNRVQLQGDFGKVISLKKMNDLYVSLGYLYEKGYRDFQNQEELEFSAYSTGQMKAGMQWRKNRLAAGAMYFLPVNGKIANGRVHIQSRFQFQLTYYPKF
ncbi:MAG: hypothetical protein GC180_04940 [Bacteroidetes bacterium]|nr:hypothetical protein [Bacteroidota bacterium]